MMTSLLSVRNLSVEFKMRGNAVSRVLNDLSFDLVEGSTIGIVGESGCGKSMTALAIMGLLPSPPAKIVGGSIFLRDENLTVAPEERLRGVRGNEISMIFQEPMTSLNPVYTVGEQIAEAVRFHEGVARKEARDRAIEMLRAVSIPVAEKRIDEYPHQLSGGMRQRVMIAMALACQPKILIADEPTTALDVTVQAQIFDLLQALQQETNTAIILITHDMGVIAEMADSVLVMYAGRSVEEAPTKTILTKPAHPYTKGLIACVPHLQARPTTKRKTLIEIPGLVPSIAELSRPGCPFERRCKNSSARCREIMPKRETIAEDHNVSCWHLDN